MGLPSESPEQPHSTSLEVRGVEPVEREPGDSGGSSLSWNPMSCGLAREPRIRGLPVDRLIQGYGLVGLGVHTQAHGRMDNGHGPGKGRDGYWAHWYESGASVATGVKEWSVSSLICRGMGHQWLHLYEGGGSVSASVWERGGGEWRSVAAFVWDRGCQ